MCLLIGCVEVMMKHIDRDARIAGMALEILQTVCENNDESCMTCPLCDRSIGSCLFCELDIPPDSWKIEKNSKKELTNLSVDTAEDADYIYYAIAEESEKEDTDYDD